MKIWRLEAYIESDDELLREDIIKKINVYLNTGDGIYLDTDDGFRLQLHKKIKDPEDV